MWLSLLERYVFRKALRALLTVAGGLVAVIWIVRAVQQVDVVMSSGQGIATYLQMASLGVPTLAAAIAPLALLIALLHTINKLNNESEFVVFHASGASLSTLLKPFLALALLTTLVVYFLALYLGPLSMATLRSFIGNVRADLVSIVVKEGTFHKVGSDFTFHVSQRMPGGALKGLLIHDTRSETETLTYLASQGRVTQEGERSYLVLRDGEIQRVRHSDGSVSIIRYQSYAFDLSSLTPKATGGIAGQAEIPTSQLFVPDTSEQYYQRYPERYVAEFHSRLSSGLYSLVICLVVLCFVSEPVSNRQGRTLVIATAASIAVGLRGLSLVAEGAVRGSDVAKIAVWAVPIVTAVICIYVLASERNPIPERWRTAFRTALNRTSAPLAGVADRLRPLANRVLRLDAASRSGGVS